MNNSYLKPSADGIRRPTDPAKENGNIINPPRYAELGGLTGPSKTAERNPFTISKPNGGRST
jgi:hypothetical protein